MNEARVVGARLSKLRAQWGAFTQRAAPRLLLWQAEADELALITMFFEVESDGEIAETPDLFLHLTSPFTDGSTHGFSLLDELIAQYAQANEDSVPGAAAWSPARIREERDDVFAWLRALAAFFLRHGDVQSKGKLGVWLDPEEVRDWPAYLQWLRRLVEAAPDALRFIVVDLEPDLPCRALAARACERVEATRCGLEVPAMLEELVAGEGGTSPSDRYRLLIVRLLNLNAPLDAARAWAAEATQIGVELGQLGLAAGAQMMLAGACCRHRATEEAVRHFAEAERLGERQQRAEEAREAAPHGSATGSKIRLTAKLGGAAVLLGVREYDGAAAMYLDGARQARAIADTSTELDCHRLASLCLTLGGARDLGWEVGMRGLGWGLGLGEELRRAPPFLQLAAHVLRMTRDFRALRVYQRPLIAQLERALGPSWPDQLESAA